MIFDLNIITPPALFEVAEQGRVVGCGTDSLNNVVIVLFMFSFEDDHDHIDDCDGLR